MKRIFSVFISCQKRKRQCRPPFSEIPLPVMLLDYKIKNPTEPTFRKRKSVLSVEQMTGIGPAYSAWEADILPLNYICQNKNSASRSFGANDGTRTHDLLITNQLLYRLSHISIVTLILSQHFLFVNRKKKKTSTRFFEKSEDI